MPANETQVVRVLLIEDDDNDRLIAARHLAGSAADGTVFALEYARSLGDGLERLARGNLDVVLLDLSLPGADRGDVVSRVAARAPRVPVIVLSGHEEADAILSAVRQGARDFLVKSRTERSSLREAILRQVAWRRALEASKR